ncbi:hypothetical protein COTS27_01381 [Spirochaetota bacterium]|nr:hypothetical protein COTS27_01381 [Spirochaetota bacterium]
MWKWIENKLEAVIFSKIWVRWVLSIVVLVLLGSGVKVLIDLFRNRHYVAEVNPYEKTVTKYKFEKDADLTKLGSAPVLSEEAFGFENIDEYYDLIAKEYEIEDFSYWDTETKQGSFSIKNQETKDAPAAVQNPLTFDTELVQLAGDLKNLKTLRRFSGYSEDEVTAEAEANDDEIALLLDKEAAKEDAIDLDVYFDEKYIRKQYSSRDIFTPIPRNKFYTSPVPNNRASNTTSALNRLKLVLDKDQYYSHDLVRVNLISDQRININDLKVYLRRGKYLIANVGGAHDIFFKYRKNTIFTTVTPGYNPSPGVYHVVIRSKADPDWKGLEKSFVLKRRKVPSIPKGFGIVNLEYTTFLGSKQIIRPSGTYGDYRALIEWINYTESDALWMLVAQTIGWDRGITPETPWKASGIRNLNLLAPVTEDNDVLLGGYIMCYYTPGNGKNRAGYNASLGYTATTDSLLDTRHISLTDPKRYRDILEMAKDLQANPYVDYIGFDFIRTGRADGYEMAEKFTEEMNVRVPADFYNYPKVEQTKWLARRIENLSNKSLILKWRWWRAHLVAQIINSVIVEGNITKPTWVFTLGWRHGQEHGQDPIMFFDAGVRIDAVMLYEASRVQFSNLMKQWNYYMRNNQNNLVIGNAVDTRFLDSLHGIPALEYVYRTKEGYRKIYRSGLAKGIFAHDLSRALWSSKRGYHVSEWALIHGHSLSAYRHEVGVIPYEAEITFNEDNKTGKITITNTSAQALKDMKITFSPTPSWQQLDDNIPDKFSLAAKEVKEFVFKAQLAPNAASKNAILGYYADSPQFPKYFFFTMRQTSPKLQQFLTYK